MYLLAFSFSSYLNSWFVPEFELSSLVEHLQMCNSNKKLCSYMLALNYIYFNLVEHGWTATAEILALNQTFRWSEKAKRERNIQCEIYLILVWFLYWLCSSVCLQSFSWGIRNNPVSTKSRSKVWKKYWKQIKGVPKRELLLILVLWTWLRQLQLFLEKQCHIVFE